MKNTDVIVPLLLVAACCVGACDTGSTGWTTVADTNTLHGAQSTAPDAGDRAFVRRAILTVWGRHPTSEAELEVLEGLLTQLNRPDLIRAMAATPDFVERWETFVRDALAVERIADRSNELCYRDRKLGDPGALLAAHIRDHDPLDSPFSSAFTMGDLIRSALRLGDLSVVFRMHQFANLVNDYALPDLAGAIAARQSRAEVFMQSHWNRRTQCLDCHNSEWSITSSTDPELNRAWPVQGLFEKALFSQSRGLPLNKIRGFFRRRGVVVGVHYENEPPPDIPEGAGVAPWGVSEACGRFFPPDDVWPDDLEDESYLGGRGGLYASVWDLELLLRKGFHDLRDGLNLAKENEVEPAEAAAWLISMHFTDRVVGEVLGARLTIDNHFPRTEAQRDMLATLTDTFVKSDYSLSELLVAITSTAVYNRPLPAEEAEPVEPFPRIFDPWVDDELPRNERTNGMGHRIHRLPGRSLLRAIEAALQVTPLREFPLFIQSPEASIHASVGVYLKEGQPEYTASTFESLLTLEHAYGSCQDIKQLDGCILETYLKTGGGAEEQRCGFCAGSEAACDWDSRCCDVPWDIYCDPACLSEPVDPGFSQIIPYTEIVDKTWMDRLIETAGQMPDATLEDTIRAVKNRLLGHSALSGEEITLMETILGTTITSPYTPASEAGIRKICGAILSSPYFILGGHAGPPGRATTKNILIVPGDEPQTVCESLAIDMFGASGWTCENTNLRLE